MTTTWDGEWTPALCAFDGCPTPARTRGYCRKHYGRWRRHGDPSQVGARHVDFDPLDDASGSVLADRYGTTRRTIVRWRRDGLRLAVAEQIADRLGVHPLELWPDIYEGNAA